MANGLLGTHATATPPSHPATQLAINNQQPATGNNLKDTKRNRKAETEAVAGAVVGAGAGAGYRYRYQDLPMFELRLQFYQRNDISLKALKGLPMP